MDTRMDCGQRIKHPLEGCFSPPAARRRITSTEVDIQQTIQVLRQEAKLLRERGRDSAVWLVTLMDGLARCVIHTDGKLRGLAYRVFAPNLEASGLLGEQEIGTEQKALELASKLSGRHFELILSWPNGTPTLLEIKERP